MFNQSGSSRTDTLVKLVLIFFISLLSFSVGTFVGKQFSDSQYKLAQLEGAPEREPAGIDPNSLEITPPDALTEEDIASLEEEFSKGKMLEAEPTTETVNSKDVMKKVEGIVTKAAENADTVSKVADKVIAGQPVTDKKAEVTRNPSSLPSRVASDVIGKYTVQVASYNNEPDAVEHTKALKDKGFSAFYLGANVKGKQMYRVSIGTYATSKEAQTYLKTIVGQADIKSAFIQKIVTN